MKMGSTKISIIIPTLGRKTLYPLIDCLLKQKIKLVYEIILVPQVKLKEELLKDKKIKIKYEPLGKGFAYYRNIGIEQSKGDIIVFIDDDELPINFLWLDTITKLIIQKKEKVVTAGVKIRLNQGYLTDSISLLGFPGGGAIGFRTMWGVTKENYTKHLCSGNLAISRKLLEEIGCFDRKGVHGNEDVRLADELIEKKIRIKYIEEATVLHVARKGFVNFVKWNILRGKSAKAYLDNSKKQGQISGRIGSSMRILGKVCRNNLFYLPGVVFMMINQYLWQFGGYIWKKIEG
jgi:glycosyltransferase involved in cell wall biosynthesis